MPIPVLATYMSRMPVIAAERELRLIEAAAIGTGAAKESDRTRRVAELEATAGDGPPEPVRPRTPDELRATARAHGIGIRTEKR